MRKKILSSVFVFLLIFLFTAQTVPGDTVASDAFEETDVRADPDAENWDIDLLDTAAEAEYLTAAEKDVILEMNKARTDPKKYADLYIRPRLQWFGGPFGDNAYLMPDSAVYTMSSEGKAAVQSCVNDLFRRQGMQPLQSEQGLFRAARDHVMDTGSRGLTGHTGSDRSTMDQRIRRYGKWDKGAGENISYGYSSGRDIVIQLLIDDGVPGRGHRNNIFNSNFKYAGAAIGDHSEHTFMCVIDFANEYTSD